MEEKIYGVDPGYLANEKDLLEKVNNYSELELFLHLSGLHSLYFYMAHDGEEISESSLLALRYLEQLTTKFGVEMQEPAPGKTSCRTKQFFEWINFWHEYLGSFTKEQQEAFKKARENGEDMSEFMPKHRWNEPAEAGIQPILEIKESNE